MYIYHRWGLNARPLWGHATGDFHYLQTLDTARPTRLVLSRLAALSFPRNGGEGPEMSVIRSDNGQEIGNRRFFRSSLGYHCRL